MKAVLALISFIVLPVAALFGEPVGPSIQGVVFDPSGAVVPGAAVALKRDDGVPVSFATSDAKGAFSLEALVAGRYEVEVRHQGFKAFTSRIAVDARPRPPMKVVLEIASVAEEVTVGKEGLSPAPRENRDAVTVDQKLLQGLPVFDQDYIATLATFLDPGAIGSDGVSLVVDGAESSRVLVSPSAIQEVKINQNPYSAEYFRPGRGRIEVVTKQGSPEYHGTFNFILRDSSLNAKDFFAPEKAPEQRRIYEGYLSGPVAGSNKSFSKQSRANNAGTPSVPAYEQAAIGLPVIACA